MVSFGHTSTMMSQYTNEDLLTRTAPLMYSPISRQGNRILLNDTPYISQVPLANRSVDPLTKALTEKPKLGVLVESNYVQPRERNKYIRRSDLPFSEELFQRILQTDPLIENINVFSFLDYSSTDCNKPFGSVLGNKNDESFNLMEDSVNRLNARTQYCAYDLEGTDPVVASIEFCGCVRAKTNEFGEDEGVVYSVLKDDNEFKEAVGAFKQRFANFVIEDIFNDLEYMTSQANAFLATAELGDALYSKVEDTERGITIDFKETRQRMHSCSGVGMKDLVADMFHPDENGETICDMQGADILLESIKNFNSCGQESSSECDPLSEFAQHQSYQNQPSDKVIADLMSFHFSKTMVRPEDIFSQVSTTASPFEKYQATLNAITTLSDVDENNNTVIMKEKINSRNMLPSDNDLASLSKLYEQFSQSGEVDLKLLNEQQLESLSRAISRNPLYLKAENADPMDAFDPEAEISQFIADLHRDKQRRIEQNPAFAAYFQAQSPVDEIKVLVINNYLERSDDLGLRCEAVKDKVRSLCASMKGNGVSLFSHPDFRDYAEEFILDEGLHQEMNEITKSERERSPLVDQLFCHANFSSISNECQESLRIQHNAKMNFLQCGYDQNWLLKHIDESLTVGSQGNFEHSHFITNERLEAEYEANKDNQRTGGASGSAFASIVSTGGGSSQVYGIEKKELSPSLAPTTLSSARAAARADKAAQNRPSQASSETPTASAAAPVPSSAVSDQAIVGNFSDKFKNSSFSAPVNNNPTVAPKVNTSNSDFSDIQEKAQAQSSANELLLNELRASEAQQKKYMAQLEELKNERNNGGQGADSFEKMQEVKEKEQEVARLAERVKELRSQVQRRQQVSQENESKPSRISSFSGSSRGSARSSAVAPTPSPTSSSSGGSFSSGPASSSSYSSAPSTAAPVAQRSVASSGLSLTAQPSSSIAPLGSNLSQLVRGLSGRDFILRDVGIPGKAEKIVFQVKDGEVLLVDGEPQIVSVELVDLTDQELAAEELADGAEHEQEDEDLVQARAPASEGVQRQVYWDEVLDLLESTVTK